MAQAVMHDRADMVWCDEFVPIKPGANARATIERKATSRAGPDLQPFAEWLAITIWVTRREDHIHHVFLSKVGNENLVDLVRASKIAFCGTAAGSDVVVSGPVRFHRD